MEMFSYDISVIIPIYNVAEFLPQCLDSVLKSKGNMRLQVIMVDDGSEDDSGLIAKSYAEMYDNFSYYYKENGGLGQARNYGVKYAKGKYLVFLDSDDIVDPDMYYNLYCAAERNHSEIAICDVARFNSLKVWDSNLHKMLFNDFPAVNATNIYECHNLLYDTTAWNKLILRSFWLENKFNFPEHILFEDIPVTIPMHTKAKSVSVIRKVGYYWRVREGDNKSITQMNSQSQNLHDRLTVLTMVFDYFENNVKDNSLLQDLKVKILKIDLMIYINIIKDAEEELAKEYLTELNAFIDRYIDPSDFEELSLFMKQKYVYARNGDILRLKELLKYGSSGYNNVPFYEKDKQLTADLPEELFTITDKSAKNEFNDFPPLNSVDYAGCSENELIFTAHLYFFKLNIRDFKEQPLKAYLFNNISGACTELRISQFNCSKITNLKGKMASVKNEESGGYNFDGIFVKIYVDISAIKNKEEHTGDNFIFIKYENRIKSGCLILKSADPNMLKRCDLRIINNSNVVRAFFDKSNTLLINFSENDIFIKHIEINQKGMLNINVNHDLDGLVLRDIEGNEIPEIVKADSRCFGIPVDNITGKCYEVLYCDADKTALQPLKISSGGQCVYYNNKILCLSSDGFSNSCIYSFNTRLETFIKRYETDEAVRLTTVTYGDLEYLKGLDTAELYVGDEIAGKDVVLARTPVEKVNNSIMCKFTLDFRQKSVNRDLYESTRQVFLRFKSKINGEKNPAVYPEIINSEIKSLDIFYTTYDLMKTLDLCLTTDRNKNVVLQIRQKWNSYENTKPKRECIRKEIYPAYRKEPIDEKCVMFESMWGRKYSCNPMHFYLWLNEHHPEYTCVWSLNDPRTPVAGKAVRVRRGSREYFHYLATAKYLFNNVNFEDAYVKRAGQIEIQTMHGTPYKTLGLDVKEDFPTEKSQIKYVKKNQRWDYLVAQGRFAEEMAWQWFRFHKTILRTGYPRTDILNNIDNETKQKIKVKLGLPLDKKFILYAPTWRTKNQFDFKLDLKQMRTALEKDYVLGVRMHHLVGKGYSFEADNKFVYDLTDYISIEDLYLIADILITDYSSVMFDFAMTGKPILFYTYDLTAYSQDLRGVYFDLQKEAPGPLLFSTDELVKAIKHIDSFKSDYADRIAIFRNKYLTYECGNSCEQIFNKVFVEHYQSNDFIFDKYNETIEKLKKIQKDLKKSNKELQNVKNGYSFRIGRVITFIPRMIKGMLKK